jgi:hypothetical protein
MTMMIDAKQLEAMRDTARTCGLTDLLVRIDRNLRYDATHTPSKELVKHALALLGVTEEPKAA